jgi:pSer/pThr/pTyr-binding forkhead associated (FHA) protein
VGRGLDNDVVLEDASVSRHHAELVRQSGHTEIRDLGSKNGTWINARRITVSPISPGDQVAFGAVQVEVARRQTER